MEITSGDFLAGGGGVTFAMKKSGLKVKWVLNHNKIAIRTNMHNNKGIKHYLANFYTQDEHEMEPVDFVWASIECTQHSRANGGREKKIGSYTLGWELLRYIKYLQPMVIGIENVPEFKEWAPLKDGKPDKTRKGEEFEKWKAAICAMGYDYHENINNAADYGIPTRRVRYFAFFTKSYLGMSVNWPAPTHSKDGKDGLKKWVPCKDYINLENEGESIFGRQFNEKIAKGKRKPLCPNTHKRIISGCLKYFPELAFIFQYYGTGNNIQSLEAPLNAITTKDRHVLVQMEKFNFIADHCHTDKYNSNGNPDANNQSLDEPLKAITSERKQQFISHHFGTGINQSLDEPMNAITTKEKIQFISAYYNSSGKPGSQNQSLDNPLNAITTGTNKQALITALENGEFDFDIKMRFLDPEELGLISTFPNKYFTDPLLKLNKKEQTRLIGNAVPPQWAQMMIEPVIDELQMIFQKKEVV